MITVYLLIGCFVMACLAAAGLIASAQNQADDRRLLDPVTVPAE